MTRIDHAAEARASLAGSGDGRNVATDASANAMAHAVLAVAEQLRVANLIALGVDVYEPSICFVCDSEPCGGEGHAPHYDEPEMLPDIAAALGLTAGQEGEVR